MQFVQCFDVKENPKNWLDKIDRISDETEKNYYALFPEEDKLRDLLPDAFVYNRPINKVGGHGYWLYEKNSCIYLAIFDCIGEGHLASMMARIYAKALKKLVVDYKIEFPGSILQFIHREIKAKFKDKNNVILNTGADLGILKIDTKDNVMDFAGARIDLWHVVDGQLKVIKGDELQIGEYFDQQHEYSTLKIDTSVPSNYYLMSSGVWDLKGGPTYKGLGRENLSQFLIKVRDQKMEEQKSLLTKLINNWKGTYEQSHDLLMIGFEM